MKHHRLRKTDMTSLISLILVCILVIVLSGCAGPPALRKSVIGYDETTANLDQQLLLLNIARLKSGLPIHFTTTSSIAATFDWTTTVGAEGRIFESPGTDFFNLNLGGSASENPTFSIIPLTGKEFTKRILTPLEEDAFNFGIFMGERVDQSMRLMSGAIEVQNPDGSFLRLIDNDPAQPQAYEEFRRIAMHLQWLYEMQHLFVRRLVFEETLVGDFKGVPRAQDINNGFDKGLSWNQKPDGNYRLTRFSAGRVVVTNYDPLTLSDQERYDLNEKIKKNPFNFVYLNIRPGSPGGEFPIQGAIKLRSLIQVIDYVASAISAAPEYDVEKDPRTGPVQSSPPVTLQINITDTEPAANVPSMKYDGKYYSIADTQWDRESFVMLSYLFQMAVGDIEDVGIPITISK